MTGDWTLRLARFALFGKAKRLLLFARPVTSAIRLCRAPEIADLVVIKTHLSHGFSLERMITERFMQALDQVVAAIPRSAAGYRRTEFSEWRPRPSGRRRNGRGSRSSRRS